MRKIKSYVRKYGAVTGVQLYHILQSQAAHARWKAYYRDNGKK